jgi:hypothetical protein
MMDADEERAREFARILFGQESFENINGRDSADWRNMLEAIDFAIETHDDVTVIKNEDTGEVTIK